MPSRRPALALILFTLITLAQSHRRGQEYTYMSMFVKPRTPDMIEGDNHLGQVYEQLSIHPRFAPRAQTRRNLRSESRAEQKETQEETEEEDQEKSHGAAKTGASADAKSGKGDLQSENANLSRLSMSDNSKVAVEVSEEMFGDEDEDEDEDEATLERETLPPKFRAVRTKKDGKEKNNSASSGDDISEQLGKKYGEDLDRLQTMLLKIITQYDIESLADIPCRAHAHWMPSFLERLTAKKKNFKYYCVDTNKEVLRSMKDTVGKLGTSKFMLRRFWNEGVPRADLVLSWAGLDNMKPENVKKYLARLSKTGDKHKIIAIGSHSGALKKRGSVENLSRFTAGGKPINIREPPFNLMKPMRIIGELATGGNDKQLYLYKANDMMR